MDSLNEHLSFLFLFVNFFHDTAKVVSKPVPTFGELPACNRLSGVDVLISHNATILDVSVNVLLRECKSFRRPFDFGTVQLNLVETFLREELSNFKGLLAEVVPVCLIERLLEVSCVVSNDRVPKSVELVDPLFTPGLKHEQVAAHITIRVVFGVAGDRVQGLVNVTKVVDKKAHVP